MPRTRRTPPPVARRARRLPDFSTLPERVAPEDLRSTQDVEPGPDPLGGRDTETEFMLRHCAP